MNHSHKPGSDHSHNDPTQMHHGHAERRGLHKDWRLWVAVIVMVGLIVYYLATLDFSH
jgi:hypothetical protein